MSIFVQLIIFRAHFRLSRVKFHANFDGLVKQNQFNLKEIKELETLISLSKDGLNTLKRVEWLYHHFLWRFLYAFILIVFILLISATSIELGLFQ